MLSADLNTQTKLEAYEEGQGSCDSLRGYKDYLASASDMIRQKDDGQARDPQAHRKHVQLLRRHQVRKEYSIEDNEIQQNFIISNQNLLSAKDQMDGSLTNLFDSLNKPLIHENKFDLTQKINDNFKDILSQSRYDNYNQPMYANDYAQAEEDPNAPPQFRAVVQPPPVSVEPPPDEDEDKDNKVIQSMTPSFQMPQEDNPYQENQYGNDYQLLIA